MLINGEHNMQNQTIISNLQTYIKELLDITITPVAWKKTSRFPYFLKERYLFYTTNLLDKKIILMIQKENAIEEGQQQTPATINKHIILIQEKWKLEVIYITKVIESYNRKRLIQNKIPFIIPGNQMYLPTLGIDLREYFKESKRQQQQEKFSPSTQLFLLYIIHNNRKKIIYTPKEAAKITGYTQMTMGRVFNELENTDIGKHSKECKERKLLFNNNNKLENKKLWNKILPYLQSPIKKQPFKIIGNTNALLNYNASFSGLSALSSYSMIAEPLNHTLSFTQMEWKRIKQESGETLKEIKFAEPEAIKVEIWSYDPKLLIKKKDINRHPNPVDKLSLYLTLKDNNDERIQGELEKMMENFEW